MKIEGLAINKLLKNLETQWVLGILGNGEAYTTRLAQRKGTSKHYLRCHRCVKNRLKMLIYSA
nr:hypothetical protein [Pseudomonas sp. C11]